MEYTAMLFTALWLGVLTAISPCPLASNIAAMSFISKDLGSAGRVFTQGVFYILGRSAVYIILAFLIVKSLSGAPAVSAFLQEYMNKALGILFVITGMFLLGLISFRVPGFSFDEKFEQRFKAAGPVEAFLLGALLALAFCPVSAALFFGSLIPLSVKAGSALLFPAMFGLGTGLPVFVFAAVIAFAAHRIGELYDNLKKTEKWARKVTGVIFILAGIYYILAYIFGVI